MNAALSNVYNHYLSAYAPPSVTRYDAHKKSELRSIYNSIVKLNKESPWYLPANGTDVQQYVIHLKESARRLHNTIASLGGLEDTDLLSKKTAFSTEPDVAAASFIGTYTPGEATPSLTLEVQNLAASQENMGSFLASGRTGLPADTYSFDVNINDMNYEFQFSIGENDTNRDIQNRLARLINNSDIGIRAHVMEAGSRSALVLHAEATGLTPDRTEQFHISDQHTSKARGAVAYLGIDYISRPASNSRFTVNGEERSTVSNTFTVGKLFEVELKGITPKGQPVHIGLKTDVESLTDNVVHLTDGYNRFLQEASAFLDTQPRSRHAIRELDQIAVLYQEPLNAMGVTRQEDGTLAVDREKLGSSLVSSQAVSDTFHTLKDFSNMLLRKSNQITINPMNYVEKKIVAYKNPGHTYANPYMTSAYSGMMFSSYC